MSRNVESVLQECRDRELDAYLSRDEDAGDDVVCDAKERDAWEMDPEDKYDLY